MHNALSRDTNTITIANFWENHLLKKYNFNPAYQRDSIWSDEKQSFFIDSLMKNFPIPPIFLHQKIDDSTGKTNYDIIDGKQRLTSIMRFIQNEIPISSEFEDSPFYDTKTAGKYFKDLDQVDLAEYKKSFWRYVIPIEYIDTTNAVLIDHIFDRLNRNGEKLKGQELRKSMYHGTELLLSIEEMASLPFWANRLENIDTARMEHYEFVSELMFQQLESKPLPATDAKIDELYKKYANETIDWKETVINFTLITNFMRDLNVHYDEYKITGVSHLYGLWCLSNYCVTNDITTDEVSPKLNNFYTSLRSNKKDNETVEEYRRSMVSRTKDPSQRNRRLQALIAYCEI
ncbi:MAG: DUF262 domain-containing protein [Colwellia sp.]|jgi:Protein of unknown function DUF262.